jgi:release factor glutamine methyltransferase
MSSILELKKNYLKHIDFLDLELLIAAAIHKPREFVLTHPEYELTGNQALKIKNFIARRAKNEPLAYILGHKEFFGLDFIVNKHTLVPRPETEILVELALSEIDDLRFPIADLVVIDIGTGSGNIIISLVKNLINSSFVIRHSSFYGIDISKTALKIAKQNAKKHKVANKINFLHGNLLSPIIKNPSFINRQSPIVILANLPYLSKEIFQATPVDVKKYEPRSALYSPRYGLGHYSELFTQLKKLQTTNHKLQTFIEFSPEQKKQLTLLLKKIFPKIKPIFHKDLAGRWRVCQLTF